MTSPSTPLLISPCDIRGLSALLAHCHGFQKVSTVYPHNHQKHQVPWFLHSLMIRDIMCAVQIEPTSVLQGCQMVALPTHVQDLKHCSDGPVLTRLNESELVGCILLLVVTSAKHTDLKCPPVEKIQVRDKYNQGEGTWRSHRDERKVQRCW